MLQLLQRLLGRSPKPQLPPFNFARNRFKAKKVWPPQLRELTEKQQFRFERKFKRRLRLKSIKPQWQKWTKIVQWSMISFVLVYGVFFHDFAKDPMNPRPGEQPFKGLRAWMRGLYGGVWTHTNSLEERRGRIGTTVPPDEDLRQEEEGARGGLRREREPEPNSRQWAGRG
jgi:hypothetical protein